MTRGERLEISRAGLSGTVAVVLTLPFLAYPAVPYDAGITASNATFILHGALPYRDFWLLYGPLSGYLGAAVTAVTGPSPEALRAAGLLVTAWLGASGYLLARTYAGVSSSVVAAVSAAVVPAALALIDLNAWSLAMALAVTGLALASRGGRSAMLSAGVLLGLAFLARLDLGAYAMIAVVLALRRRSLPAIAGFLAVAVPIVLVFLVSVPLASLIDQLIWYPTVGLREYRSIPWPSPWPWGHDGSGSWLMAIVYQYLPMLLIGLAGLRLLVRRRAEAPLLTLILFAAMAQLQALGRADTWHAAQAATPALLLGAWLADAPRAAPRLLVRVVVVAPVLLVLLATAVNPSVGSGYEDELGAAAEYVRERTSEGEPIFIGEATNRYTFSNPLIAYHVADRPAGVRVAQFNPGVTNTDVVQAEMVADLERSAVRYLILDREYADHCEPWNRSCEPGSYVLDRYIADAFRPDRDFGDVVVMVRR